MEDILKLVYNYVDDKLVFDYQKFKNDYPAEYDKLMEQYGSMNNMLLYCSLYKSNRNKFRERINELKNYLVYKYITESKMNGLTYTDMIDGTDFSILEIRTLFEVLKEQYEK